MQHVCHQKRHYPPENSFQRDILGNAFHDINIDSHRWGDLSDFADPDQDDSEPYRIETQGVDNREKNWHGDHDHGDGTHDRAEKHIDKNDDGQNHIPIDVHIRDDVGQAKGQAGDGKKVPEHHGTDQDDKGHGCGFTGFFQTGGKIGPFQLIPEQGDDNRAESTHAGGLSRRKQAKVNPADN